MLWYRVSTSLDEHFISKINEELGNIRSAEETNHIVMTNPYGQMWPSERFPPPRGSCVSRALYPAGFA